MIQIKSCHHPLQWELHPSGFLSKVRDIILHCERDEKKVIYCRGIRGATTVDHNDREEILAATRELLELLIEKNDLKVEDIVSAIFSTTEDLDAEFPAVAARELGWTETALMCAREIPVPNSLQKCIRVLIHVNTTRSAQEIQHVYIKEAVSLRPTFSVDA